MAAEETFGLPVLPPGAVLAGKVANFINAIQKSQPDRLFSVANNCAHPKEAVKVSDVERLIREDKQLTALIV